jgi:hypothetical protein
VPGVRDNVLPARAGRVALALCHARCVTALTGRALCAPRCLTCACAAAPASRARATRRNEAPAAACLNPDTEASVSTARRAMRCRGCCLGTTTNSKTQSRCRCVCARSVCVVDAPPPTAPPAARCSCSPTSLSPRGNLVVNQEVASRSASKASGCQEMLARLTSCASHVYMYEDPALQVGLCRASGRPCEAVVISGSRWCCCCCSVVLLHAQLEALGVIPLASLLKAAKDNASPKARWRGSHPPDSVTPWCSADASSLCATAADVWTGAAVPAAALVPR